MNIQKVSHAIDVSVLEYKQEGKQQYKEEYANTKNLAKHRLVDDKCTKLPLLLKICPVSNFIYMITSALTRFVFHYIL